MAASIGGGIRLGEHFAAARPVIAAQTRFVPKGSVDRRAGLFVLRSVCFVTLNKHRKTFGGSMIIRAFAARFALVVACALMTGAPAFARTLQCVPFAREVSGIDIRGNANTWWNQADGRYDKGSAPKVGAVLAFSAIGKMPYGHVAMVSRIVSDREVLLTHANWSRRGGIERDVRAIDVSEAGDWSAVRVWYAPTASLGTTVYPTRGFIYADGAPQQDQQVPLQIARASSDAGASADIGAIGDF